MTANYQQLLEEIAEEVRPLIGQGHVANYIPALARVDPDNFGMALRTISGEEFAVADSEQEYGHRNAALAHFMKSYGNMYDTVERTLSIYFRQCAIAMSCRELARAFSNLANDGVATPSGGIKQKRNASCEFFAAVLRNVRSGW